MGKNKNKGKPPVQPMAQKPQSVSPVSPDIAEGKSEKEKLINEGQSEKARLIAEGQAEKENMIEQAKSEARNQAEAEREKIIEAYKNQVKEEAIAEAEKEKKRILAEAKEKESNADTLLEEAKIRQKELAEKDSSLEKKLQQYMQDSAKLDSDKQTYKSEILSQFQQDADTLRENVKKIEQENNALMNAVKKLEKELSLANADKDEYEKELDDNRELRQEIIKQENEIADLTSETETLTEIKNELQEKLSSAESLILRYGVDPLKAIKEKEALEKELTELQDRYANYPSEDELNLLRLNSQRYDQIIAQNETLKEEAAQKEKELFAAKIYQSDFDNSTRFIKVLELQRSELQTELDRITDRYNKQNGKIFSGLTQIDSEPVNPLYKSIGISLKDLCSDFKNFLATEKHLFYSDVHIRSFIAGFAAVRLIILEGLSGTGKSSLPREFGAYTGGITHRIPVQSSWKDRNDLLGFYNDFEKRYKETEFLKALYTSAKDGENIHCIILDEMNLSRIEYYFADLLSVLEEPDSQNWKINLIPDAAAVKGDMPRNIINGDLYFKENVWFIGTANKDDSTFMITDKVYDRAITLDFKERSPKPAGIQSQNNPIKLGFGEFQSLLHDAVKCSEDKHKKIDDAINSLDEQMRAYFEISFGNRINLQIHKFVPAYEKCGGTMNEAIDIIFSTKVLRKVQGYDKAVEDGLDALLKDLEKDYPKEFVLSKSIIQKIKSRI